MPDDASLVDRVLDVVPEAPLRQLLFVDNPSAFFGFASARAATSAR
jgi:hypothetical protein